ncbi:MAG TPA: IS110 family transposase, partial [Bacteroidia bacterium]|nr:IS110 family transposase [Bacteroidia bacterium]
TMCALNTIKKENEFKLYYDRRIREGKSAMSTINILRNKLVSRVFATIKRGTPYSPDIHTAA